MFYEPEDTSEQPEEGRGQLAASATQESAGAVVQPEFATQKSLLTTSTSALEDPLPPELYGQQRSQEADMLANRELDASEPVMASTRDEDIRQSHESKEPAEVQNKEQQKPSEGLASSLEIGTTKRQRGSIREKPAGAEQVQPRTQPSAQAHTDDLAARECNRNDCSSRAAKRRGTIGRHAFRAAWHRSLSPGMGSPLNGYYKCHSYR